MITLITRAGAGKDHSEDAVLADGRIWVNTCAAFPFQEHALVCVADGVGGEKGGEVAASYVLDALKCLSDEDIRSEITLINDRLLARSVADPALAGMATTLTGVYFGEDALTLLHIGNTRAYVLQGSYLKQLTSDHTLYNWLKSSGRREEAEHCNRNEIIACLGGGSKRFLEKLHIADIPPANTLLLTSDGIHDHVEIDELERVMGLDISDMEKCERLIQLAVASGSRDDLTVVLIRRD